jgi:Polyketide cyclase / dehydrase and lipid transport
MVTTDVADEREQGMATTIHMNEITTATPQQVLAALTDFGPGRGKLFGNSTDSYLTVHSSDASHADVTEGSKGIWERLQYDWTDPQRIVMTTVDSNAWGGASGHTYTLTPRPDGGTGIDVVVVREAKNVRGRIIELALRTGGKSILKKELAKTVKAIEARNGSAGTA